MDGCTRRTQEDLKNLPDLTRTKLCKSLINTGACDDPECTYAHSKEELRPAPVPDAIPKRQQKQMLHEMMASQQQNMQRQTSPPQQQRPMQPQQQLPPQQFLQPQQMQQQVPQMQPAQARDRPTPKHHTKQNWVSFLGKTKCSQNARQALSAAVAFVQMLRNHPTNPRRVLPGAHLE